MTVFERDRLDNGVRIVTASLPHAQSTACHLMYAAGSRYEEAETNGLAHFVEHMLFKGTPRRPSMRSVTGAIETIGGRLNASTGKDHTFYHAKAPPSTRGWRSTCSSTWSGTHSSTQTRSRASAG